MAQGKKFGTFGGVFTPSILTILGVIMYLRLPWIVGQAGFFLTVGIILVAHIVSVCTGLSVSSIATDKKVKAGGTYYIISRTLGLPIGGTLGIALFFGLSFSVSLYLIGFSESFLGFWDLPITKDTIRLTGTIAILAVGTLTFISTSLAIKTQYFIMTAIGLSLVTILFGKTDFIPAEPLLQPVSNMAPMILLFAIFFPAVTGFEAGVSMSGDLRDPKRSIPVGTISAIVLGLFVYIGLAAFFSFRVNSDQLINNPKILLELSFFPPLLVAGIWGATISSAIGSILSAPRILQATSSDRITPHIFAKGYGKSNEPRNALILTFIIAETGILIGELNIIARVVTMFFVTTYGFLNLSSAVEKLASTDFRPSFKIPTPVSIIGASTCFILMLELDFLALIGATLIMGSIFLYLKKRELILETGDTWEGVWSSLLRLGLNRLNRTVKQQRNWRPNIILFSGGSTARPYLVQFGRWLVHKRGILSNFNLVESKKVVNLLSFKQQQPEEDKEFQGIFTRNMEVNDIYEGMETITKVYGFAGIEPNTVMLGWGRNSKNPDKFAELIRTFSLLDHNIFILDYDHERGFGNNKTIDLWWSGSSNNVTLALTLIKFLSMSEEWEESQTRIFIVNDDSSRNNRIYRNVINVLDDQRITAELKIINNAVERKPISEIIKTVSHDSDLVILGLPEDERYIGAGFITDTDKIIKALGTVVLIHASSFFKSVYIGIDRADSSKSVTKQDFEIGSTVDVLPQLILPKHEILANTVNHVNEEIWKGFTTFQQESVNRVHAGNNTLISDIKKLIQKNYDDFEQSVSVDDSKRSRKLLARIRSNYLYNSQRIMQKFQQEVLPEYKEILTIGIQTLLSDLQQIKTDSPEELIVSYEQNEISGKDVLPSLLEKMKPKSGNKLVRRKIYLHVLIDTFIYAIEKDNIYKLLKEIGLSSYRLISELQRLFISTNDSLEGLEAALENGDFNAGLLTENRSKSKEWLRQITGAREQEYTRMVNELRLGLNQALHAMTADLENPHINYLIKKRNKAIKKQPKLNVLLEEIPDYWVHNQQLIGNFFIEDLFLKNFQNRIRIILERFINDVQSRIDTNYTTRIDNLIKTLESAAAGEKATVYWPAPSQEIFNSRQLFNDLLKDIVLAEEELPEDIEIMAEESFQNIEQEQFGDVTTLNINLRHYADFLVETEMIDTLQRHFAELDALLLKTEDVAQDVVRFTNYNVSLTSDAEEAVYESLQTTLSSGLERIRAEKQSISDAQRNLRQEFERHLKLTFEKMNPYLISRSFGELNQTIRTHESRKIIARIVSFTELLKTRGKSILVWMVYRRSEGVLLAKKFGETSDTYQTATGYMLEKTRLLSPDTEIYSALPIYYLQLFLGKQMINREFLVERKYETDSASRIVDLYNQGYSGGMLVLGERYSGKSTLSRSIAATFFERQNIYQVFPPESGSIDPAEFRKRLAEAVQLNGDYDTLFNALPKKSVIIFHDLELWWERSPDGFAVIDELTDLIGRYGDSCFFIVNAGTYGFNFINRLKSVENTFIGAIKCQQFDSEELQKAILLRHRSSGLTFELDNHAEGNVSKLHLARLFNKYFDITDGNIGQAMHYWISNIKRVQSHMLYITTPIDIDDITIDKLNSDWLVLLQQFMLHKRLTAERFGRIVSSNGTAHMTLLESLRRSGLIREIESGVLHINPYLQPLVTKRLSELDLV
ncbi:MAG: amino acid permease [Candidatus Latescibacteria bacterium]|nr:amino acid permease [Candidatus Latescibacterota bacterium]